MSAQSGVDIDALGVPVSQKVGDVGKGQAVVEKARRASVAERLRAGVLGEDAYFLHAFGEYGFLTPGAVATANAASQGEMYTFRIVE